MERTECDRYLVRSRGLASRGFVRGRRRLVRGRGLPMHTEYK